uniref:Nodule cysteine-rich protein 12 n=1 Tax=Cicer arietinum TaxID=3827 RepID=A0A0U8TCS0_CICAR|nr:TPA_exp: nodule cysteine-rich protein 12 [Cicer arietinum]
MAQIFVFVYALIIFLSLSLVVSMEKKAPCNSWRDCEEFDYYEVACIDGFCEYQYTCE